MEDAPAGQEAETAAVTTIEQCSADSDCAFGKVCSDGECVEPQRIHDEGCTQDADCPVGRRCATSTGLCVTATDYPTIPSAAGEPCEDGERRFCGTKIGACEYGTQACVGGFFSEVCEGGVGPTAERCDAIDNDCDGATDEDFNDLGTECSAGIGICRKSAVMVCGSDGAGTACGTTASAPNPLGELCGNTLDDDCDGETDEGYPTGDACSVGTGVCAASGTLVCTADMLGTECNVQPLPPDFRGEVCGNALDDDCDGSTDDGYFTGEACSEGTGICRREGHTVCAASGLAIACDAIPGAPAAAELCGNGLDDDCDGATDEGFEPLGSTCSMGVGACRRTGALVCTADLTAMQCSVSAGEPAAVDLCGNGIDDDCDGITDEGYDIGADCEVGIGICRAVGVKVCTTDGLATRCDASPGAPDPAGELCGNDLDDDCNGLEDEIFDDGAACSAGTGACERSGVKVCTEDRLSTICGATAGAPDAELCGNGVDDDCDALTDEGFDDGVACTSGAGACERSGVKVCRVDGLATVCSVAAGDAVIELCGNGSDDDCDGATDEGFDDGAACGNGLGICARTGVMICSADRLSTACNASAGQPNAGGELCGNSLDDDCDGAVDEGFDNGAACGAGTGICARSGLMVCSADRRSTTCDAVPGQANAAGELCGNSLDDDCDGSVDEGFDTGAPCSTGTGACTRQGVRVCTADRLGTTCGAVAGAPSGELCGNTVDDDCDGSTDEGFDTGVACSVGVGTCERAGQKVCAGDGFSTVCSAAAGGPEAAGELCGNALDDDCDGSTDEGYDNGAACRAGTGICERSGVMVCSADRLGTECNVQPGAANSSGELCGNAFDDDCDGSTDEQFDVGVECTVGLGICLRAGYKACTADELGTYCTAIPGDPVREKCNGIDDDCDGVIDDGFDLGTACATGSGVCQATGQNACNASGTGTECKATGKDPDPLGERCADGLDNDCDGATDEYCQPPLAVCSPQAISIAPLQTVALDGSSSRDPGNGQLTYSWRVLLGPAGSTSDPSSPATAATPFFVDLAGDYQVELVVTNPTGLTDRCVVDISAVPTEQVHVELVWQEDSGDLDLHLTKPGVAMLGGFFDTSAEENDCWAGNPATDWTPAGAADGDASLVRGDTAGNGPEDIGIALNPATGDYHVGVHMRCDQSMSGGTLSGARIALSARVRIHCNGVLVDEIPTTWQQLTVGQLWIPATVHWDGTGCTVSRQESVEWGVKYCRALGGCTTTSNDCVPQRTCASDSECRSFETCRRAAALRKDICMLNSACVTSADCPTGMTCDERFGNLCAR